MGLADGVVMVTRAGSQLRAMCSPHAPLDDQGFAEPALVTSAARRPPASTTSRSPP
jgi:hypothetical protein